MSHPYRDDQLQNWTSEFLDSTRFGRVQGTLREYAPQVLQVFLQAACAVRDVEPSELEEADVRAATLEQVARLDLPASVHAGVPDLLGHFLEEMEAAGRLSEGRAMGLFVRALKEAYGTACGEKPKPIVRPAPAIGRNEPCPCGSGLKYKKCCLRAL